MPKKKITNVERQVTTLVASIPESATMLGVCCKTVYRLIGSGDIQSVTIGGSRKIRLKEIERYLDENSTPVRKAS